MIDEDEVIWSGKKVFVNSNVISENDIKLIRLKGGKLYVQKSESSEIIDLNTFEKDTLPFVGKLISKDVLLYGKYNEDYTKRTVYAIECNSQEELWSRENSIGKIYWEDEKLFGSMFSTISRVDQQTGLNIWEYDLSKLGKYEINGELKDMDLHEYIGIYKNCLYIKAGISIILGLNINTGQIEFKSNYQEDFLVLNNLRLDELGNCIFSIGARHYIEFNLESSEYALFDLTTQTLEHQVETTRLAGWDNDKIYFWEGSLNNKFGEFSRKEINIKWSKSIDEVDGKFPAIKDIKYGKDKLYVNDHNNKLHIYKLKEYAS